jgi:hypothetical protein
MTRKTPVQWQPGTAGEKFRAVVLENYELREDEVLLLDQAAATLDTIEALDAALLGAPLTVPGSLGQQREHPLLSECRQQRAALARLLKQLELESEAGVTQAGRRSMAGRALARQRWGTR